MHDYAIYGIMLRSDHELPGLVRTRAAGERDLMLSLGRQPAWAATGVTRLIHRSSARPGETPVVIVEELGAANGIRLRYDEGIRFHVSASTDSVWADWDDPLTIEDAMTFLVGPVLGFILRRRGVLALHASAAVIGGRLVGFVGAGGAGKSTLVASLAARGHAVFTDDVLALRESGDGWVALPSHGQVRLWDESARLLFGDARALPPLSATWEKRGLDLRDRRLRFHEEPTRLEALLLIDGESTSGAAPELTPATGADGLLFMVGNTYVSYLLDAVARAAELKALGRLSRGIAASWLRRPQPPLGHPAAVAEAVEAWALDLTK